MSLLPALWSFVRLVGMWSLFNKSLTFFSPFSGTLTFSFK